MTPRPFAAFLVFLLAACAQQEPARRPIPTSDVKTIENTPIRTAAVEQPPQIVEQQAEPKLRDPWATPEDIRRAQEDAKKRVPLPFAPAIAMDPVDGSKVSIRTDTPTFEYKGKIYYFGSPGNRASFIANPEQYVKGALSRY